MKDGLRLYRILEDIKHQEERYLTVSDGTDPLMVSVQLITGLACFMQHSQS